MPFSSPVDVGGSRQVGDTTGESGCRMYGPFVFGSVIYIPTTSVILPAGPTQMNKSVDNGVTWTAIVAPVNMFNFACYVSGTDIIFMWVDANDDVIQTASFDTLTDTWSVLGVTLTLSNHLSLCDVSVRATDTLLIYMQTDVTFSLGNFFAVSFDGLVFGTPFSIDDNLPANGIGNPQAKCCVDNVDRTHVFILRSVQFSGITKEYYQAIESSNALGSFHDFGSITGSANIGGPGYDDVLDAVIWPYSEAATESAVIAIGLPASGPAWTTDIGTDPDNILSIVSGNAFVAGGSLYVVNITDDSSGNPINAIRVLVTARLDDPTLGWSGSYAVDGNVGDIAPDAFISNNGVLIGSSLAIIFDADTTNPPPDRRAFFVANFPAVFTGPFMIDAGSLPVIALTNPFGKC
jgi:hypothetical protein